MADSQATQWKVRPPREKPHHCKGTASAGLLNAADRMRRSLPDCPSYPPSDTSSTCSTTDRSDDNLSFVVLNCPPPARAPSCLRSQGGPNDVATVTEEKTFGKEEVSKLFAAEACNAEAPEKPPPLRAPSRLSSSADQAQAMQAGEASLANKLPRRTAGGDAVVSRSLQTNQSTIEKDGRSVLPCYWCNGEKKTGLMKFRGLGLFTKKCNACNGSGLAGRKAKRHQLQQAEQKDDASGPSTSASGAMVLVGAAIVISTASLAAEVPIVGSCAKRAYELVRSISKALRTMKNNDQWMGDLCAYLQVAAITLQAISSRPAPKEDLTRQALQKAVVEVADLLERLDELLATYVTSDFLNKFRSRRRFQEQRREVVGALGLWNASVSQIMQVASQDSLDEIAKQVGSLQHTSALALWQSGKKAATSV
eukprot:TRINITY_DN10563_c0_g1_i1.p1 TRINITY_DN10563_c0_g1~~TRINITY_DN10563_c0_g1_i1.p1  ORF type:complete len:423 (-),score=62.24 TRINITY_DN10563_c0_g1_i1:722-1990(-)